MVDSQTPNDSGDFGDFVRDEDQELDLEEIVEPWANYDTTHTPNVFYPISLGEVLDGRYLIEHKLGHGGGSTVWMAHDLQTRTDVALKVLALGGWGENEGRMQPEISRTVKDTSHLVLCLRGFVLPEGASNHRVLVFPLMGPCVDRLTLENIPIASRMSAARQLLEALESLHSAGIVHRDLNERNCMWGIKPLGHLTRNSKYQALGRPLKQSIPFVELWKQGELVSPVKVPEDLRTEKFYLGDFGLAKKLGDSATERGIPPMQFCSPERLHRKEPSFACDIWSYMIIFSMLYLCFPPFPTFIKGGVISAIVRTLGPLPKHWQGSYADSMDYWYDQSQEPDPKYDLASIIANFRPDADPVERQHVLAIMARVFIYDPEKRPTATELLRDPSFRAIMNKYEG